MAYQGAGDHFEHINFVEQNFFGKRSKTDVIDLHHDRWTEDERHLHDHITNENGTHTTDSYCRYAVETIAAHDPKEPLFMNMAFQAPHWPTQFYQHYADMNTHIPGRKRREFAAMITQLDDGVRRIMEALKAKDMWQNTVTIAHTDNGGDVRTGASNFPHRGTKATPWEGGTKAACFIHSMDPRIIPEERRGTTSHALAHVTDWFPTVSSQAIRLLLVIDGSILTDCLCKTAHRHGRRRRVLAPAGEAIG